MRLVALKFEDEAQYSQATLCLAKAGIDLHQVQASSPLPDEFDGKTVSHLNSWGIVGGLVGFLLVAGWIGYSQFSSFLTISQGRSASVDQVWGWIPGIFEAIILGSGLALICGFVREGQLGFKGTAPALSANLPAWSFLMTPELSLEAESALRKAGIPFQRVEMEASR
jgi:hypothetical protein